MASAMTAMRREGVFVPAPEVEAYLANGWSIADDLIAHDPAGPVRLCGCGEVVLMAPPAVAESEAA